MRRDVFQAIADPTRRDILHIISHKSLNVNAVAENFDVSRTAIYKHIKILTECGLISVKQQGRERYCEAKLKNWAKCLIGSTNTKSSGTTNYSLEDYLNALQNKEI